MPRLGHVAFELRHGHVRGQGVWLGEFINGRDILLHLLEERVGVFDLDYFPLGGARLAAVRLRSAGVVSSSTSCSVVRVRALALLVTPGPTHPTSHTRSVPYSSKMRSSS